MSAHTEQRKLAAIMFTDLVGFSTLAQRNEALALELLAESQRLLRTQFLLFDGREVKTTGDGFLVEFPSALQAAQCAVEIQRAVVARNATGLSERHFQVRIGIHVGDVVHREADMYGDGVNIAARIEPLAIGGGICLSDAVYGQVRNKLGAQMTKLDAPELKNIELPIDVYRVVLPWQQPAPAAVKSLTPASLKSRTRKLAAGLAGVLVLFAVGVGWFVRHRGSSTAPSSTAPGAPGSAVPGRITSLAVKPLDDFSGDTNNAYLSDGMTEALCAALGNVRALRVPGRSSMMRFKGGQKSIQEIAKELNVEAVVEGSIQRAGTRILITVQLISASTDRHLWATNYERDLSDFFKVQSEVAQAIATEIQVRLTPEDQARLGRARPANRDAIEACLLGMHHLRQLSDEGTTNALRYFQKAIEIDPGYAPAHAGAALAYGQAGAWYLQPAREAMPKSIAAAQRAIELDPLLADGYVARGNARLGFDWNWAGAEKDLKQAMELDPNSFPAVDGYCWFLLARGRFGEATLILNKAVAVDTLSPLLYVDLAWAYHYLGQYELALPVLRKALALDHDFFQAHYLLGWTYLRAGRTNEALAEFRTTIKLDPDSAMGRMALGFGLGYTGRATEALKVLEDLDQLAKKRHVTGFAPAVVHLALGQKEIALDWIEKAYEERDPMMAFLKEDPGSATLHNEPRFQALVKKVENGGRED